jgi:hypothetical protein
MSRKWIGLEPSPDHQTSDWEEGGGWVGDSANWGEVGGSTETSWRGEKGEGRWKGKSPVLPCFENSKFIHCRIIFPYSTLSCFLQPVCGPDSCELYSTLLHLPPLRYHYVAISLERCWDHRTQDCCNVFIIDTLSPLGMILFTVYTSALSYSSY